MKSTGLDDSPSDQGDEIKEIADFCYVLDQKLKNQHEELERRISDATRDLCETNKSLEAANRQLANLNKAKSEFFSDVSHELRTPLTSIKGAVDILERKGSCADPIYLDIIKRNTDHLIKTVVDFLDYSKIESGQLELDRRTASLKSIAEDAILSQAALAQKRAIDIRLDAPDEMWLTFDKQRIYQVLMNLLSNAVKFSPDGGSVYVRLIHSDKDSAEVWVEDQGPGIDRKYHSAVFERFFQIPDSDSARVHHGSSGIGLAICKWLVNSHGGAIWVESEPGKGSRFVFSIPGRE
jgi:signal transduction histidine kinase